MNKKITVLLLCLLLLCSLSSCNRAAIATEREESGGTGYGVSQKSAVTMQDLYGLRPGTDRAEVTAALGSPQTYIIAENNTDTYRLQDGGTLVLTYSDRDEIKTAVFTDTAGAKQDLFGYLNSLGIIKNYVASGEPETEQQPQEDQPNIPKEPEVTVPTEDSGYFSNKRYSYELAEQVLRLGIDRATVVSAWGKPNSFSSVTFTKDSYIVDVYAMDDGSTLYLDYGYNREKLRAVQQVKGSAAANYMGTWGQEDKPSGYIRYTRNQQVFKTLKKNTKPSEIYRRFGEPDWLEGNGTRYRDAYQLLNGSILYLDFGPGHNSLTAAVLEKTNGTVVNYTLD